MSFMIRESIAVQQERAPHSILSAIIAGYRTIDQKKSREKIYHSSK
jgi:hypothetical protein